VPKIKQDHLKFVGAVATVVAALWALAVTAAEHVMEPHRRDAKQRVHIMCGAQRVSNKKINIICEAVGASKDCASLDSEMEEMLLAGCEEDGK
jgi:hypothetical protein